MKKVKAWGIALKENPYNVSYTDSVDQVCSWVKEIDEDTDPIILTVKYFTQDEYDELPEFKGY